MKKSNSLNITHMQSKEVEGGLRTKGEGRNSYNHNPLVSIVTVVFNGERFLEGTIKSVLNQTYENVEYIIIDGGSADGTLDIIRQYKDEIDYWRSKKDQGIYDAMNQGIALCTGEIIGIISADDFYDQNTISLVVKTFQKSHADIIFGNKLMINEEIGLQRVVSVAVPDSANNTAINNVHPTVFVARQIYEKFLFDTSYKIAADYDLMIRFFGANYKFEKIDSVLVVMRSGGASSLFNLENVKIRYKYFGIVAAMKKLITVILKMFLNNILRTFGLTKQYYLKKGWESTSKII
jgi:glycosyltransferase involved in cell wall biosynthesis